jgi:hypothetical protein
MAIWPKGIYKMSLNLDDVAKDIAAIINKLGDVSQRKELIAKISAVSIGGDLTTVGADNDAPAWQINSLAASTAEGARKKLLSPIQASNAGPNNLSLVRNALARARRLAPTYEIKESEVVNFQALDYALKCQRDKLTNTFDKDKHLEHAFILKADLSKLSII